jgi:prepilin-type N-terminal cleavage/methylation domain-containing protein
VSSPATGGAQHGCILPGGRAGITLVELIVVMAILGVLIALAVPVIGRVLDEANAIQCRANLRSLGQCVLVYAKDHDGALPVSDVVDGPHPALVAALRPYVQDPRVYYCPSETAPERVFSQENAQAGRIGQFYYSCERATRNGAVSTFLRWNVKWPRRLRNDTASPTWVASDAWFSGEPTAHRYYQKGVNYLTLGGEVQMVTESPRAAFK